MTATPEQRALVADPSTTAHTLADLAYAEPDLWPAIAVHPNVYPGLLEWMQTNGSAQAMPAVDVSSGAPPEQDADGGEPDQSTVDPMLERQPEGGSPAVGSPAPIPATPPTPVWRRISPRVRKRIIAGASAVAAIATVAILLVALVFDPQQRAAATAELAHKNAVSDFQAAKSDCAAANDDLDGGIARAQRTVDTDVSTMDDPSLIDQLKKAIPAALKTSHCAAPRIAAGTGAIVKQTDSLIAATASVRSAATDIANASGLVDASVAKKAQAAADAAAAAQAAAAAAAAAQRTWHFESADGYSFDMALAVAAPTTSGTLGQYRIPSGCTGLTDCTTKTVAVGEGCPNFDSKTMIAIPITATFTARTTNFDTRVGASLRVGTSGSYQGPNDVGYGFLGSYVEEEAVYSNGPDCATGSYGGPSFGVSFPTALKAGQSASFSFDIIIEKWTSPNAPGGDTALLDWLTIVPGATTPQDSTESYSPDSSKSITLKGNVIGG